MNHIKSCIRVLTLALMVCACESKDEIVNPQSNIQLATGVTQDVSLTSAMLLGTISMSGMNYTEVGFAYGLLNSGSLTYVSATDVTSGSAHRSFSATISGLQPDATYFYTAYVKDANGNLITADDQKTFDTKSPADLLQYAVIQYVAMRDATFCWDITNEKFYSELQRDLSEATFGIVCSTDREAVIQTGSWPGAAKQAVVFTSGPQSIVKFSSLQPATNYYYSTYVNMNGKLYASLVSSFSTISSTDFKGTAPSGVQVVDLDLPSGTLWASMNVGAEKEEDIGLFFAWGETTGYVADGSDDHLFGWASYRWCSGSRASQTKYCTSSDYGTVDNKVNIDLIDDAAYINWGEQWRMPTNEEVKELMENTHSLWTTQNGVDGYMFTSRTNGNSIFLPAGGCRVSESNYENGTDCYYWAATVDVESPYAARYLRFYVGKVFLASLFRYYGMNVRPVRRK